MKKVLFTAFAAVAMMALVACNNNKPAEETNDSACDTTKVEQACDMHQCDGSCCQCGEECKAANCENCDKCGTPECCGENAGKCCKAEGAVEGQACEKQCDKQCEKKCEEAK